MPINYLYNKNNNTLNYNKINFNIANIDIKFFIT